MKILKSVYLLFIASTFINVAHAEIKLTGKKSGIIQDQVSIDENTIPSDDERSRFSILAQWFTEGEIISLDKLQGWFSGRCYYLELPNFSTNALLSLTTVKDGTDEGPGFPTTDLHYLIIATILNDESKALPPEFFDNYDGNIDNNNYSSLIASFINNGYFSPVKENDSNMPLEWTLDIEKNGSLDLKYKIKKHDNYLVVQVNNLIKNNPLFFGTSGKVIKYDIGPVGYCYFFKKIRD